MALQGSDQLQPTNTGGYNTTSAILNQNNNMLGTPQIQAAAMPTFDPGMLNSTTVNPDMMNMIKALKGGS